MKEYLKNIVDNHDSKIGKYFDLLIQLLIILNFNNKLGVINEGIPD